MVGPHGNGRLTLIGNTRAYRPDWRTKMSETLPAKATDPMAAFREKLEKRVRAALTAS